MLHCGSFCGNSCRRSHQRSSRQQKKKTLFGFFALLGLFFILFLSQRQTSPVAFYAICALSGVAAGYFGLFCNCGR